MDLENSPKLMQIIALAVLREGNEAIDGAFQGVTIGRCGQEPLDRACHGAAYLGPGPLHRNRVDRAGQLHEHPTETLSLIGDPRCEVSARSIVILPLLAGASGKRIPEADETLHPSSLPRCDPGAAGQ